MACFDGPSNESSLDGFLLHIIYHLFVSACSWRRWQECSHNTTHTEPVSTVDPKTTRNCILGQTKIRRLCTHGFYVVSNQ